MVFVGVGVRGGVFMEYNEENEVLGVRKVKW